MKTDALKMIGIVTLVILGVWCASQPQAAGSETSSGPGESAANVQPSRPIKAIDNPISVQFSRDELDSLNQALPDGKARQMLNAKVTRSRGPGKTAFDDSLREGEEFSLIFFKGERAFSRAQKRLVSFFTESGSTFDTSEWTAAFDNLNSGRGPAHLGFTVLVAALFIVAGLAIERLVRRSTESLRRQILATASLGPWHFLGRVLSRLLLNVLGTGTYILVSFVLWAIFYDEGDPGYAIVSGLLLPSYYIRFFMLIANLVLSPATPALRLFPLQDEDARFLYRWTIAIVVTAIAIADIAFVFLGAGIGQENFLFMYSLSGLSVSLLVAIVIWRCRHRVARAILNGGSEGDGAASSMRAKFAKSWHWFALLYVIGMGFFWFIRGMAAGEVAMLSTIVSVFLIPLLIGISSWTERLLEIASGAASSSFISPGAADPRRGDDPASGPSETAGDQQADKISYLQQHLVLIKTILRILLVALLFFIMSRLWGIDMPLGRLFTSTALNIMGLLLLGIVVWQFAKARIDRKIREEMPQGDDEMEEGGRGGSRLGTLLVLLRKFILSVLFVIISLIALSTVGLDIGPLIAGAGVIGLAIGFGSQTLVRDILSGFFFLIDDAFRVGDYIETGGIKGMVEHISLRSVKLRHPRGMVFTIPFGDMGAVQNFSRDYIITKLDVRVRYDADVDRIRKIVKKINRELQKDEEIGPVLLSKIKSQGVREMDDSAMILRIKFKTPPGEQFVVRREVYKRIQECFREEGIEFAHRNVTVYLPPDTKDETPDKGQSAQEVSKKKLLEAGAAAAAASRSEKAEI